MSKIKESDWSREPWPRVSNSQARSVSSVSSISTIRSNISSISTMRSNTAIKYVVIKAAVVSENFHKRSAHVATLKKGTRISMHYTSVQEGNVKYTFPRAYITYGGYNKGWISMETSQGKLINRGLVNNSTNVDYFWSTGIQCTEHK
eukprot:UN27471